MQRILIIGSGGAGKSTLARQMGILLGLPVIHLDQLYWQPGWIETPREIWLEKVLEIVQTPSWIMDGNFGSTLDIRLQAADTAILLDMPAWLCILRVLKRQLMYRNQTRPDMGAGCPEKVDWEFLQWIWRFPHDDRPEIERKLAYHRHTKRIIVLRTSREMNRLLHQLQP